MNEQATPGLPEGDQVTRPKPKASKWKCGWGSDIDEMFIWLAGYEAGRRFRPAKKGTK